VKFYEESKVGGEIAQVELGAGDKSKNFAICEAQYEQFRNLINLFPSKKAERYVLGKSHSTAEPSDYVSQDCANQLMLFS
jgi:hypothetical protein